ncbi:MAG: radical SAM family heme chaperone HemW [Deltaproteobacteria bacterium]|nr:radical SAM family heme chaperone HemW [Deltaproteobacteria bacterium]
MRPLLVYVHFPWCLEKCPYCDFVSYKTDREAIDHDAYADAIVRELEARRPWLDGHALSSIFLGGGTPSLWAPHAIARVLEAIRASFPPPDPRQADLEITAECNPSSLDRAVARELVGAGVGRLSVGVQSLDGAQLKFLGRLHDVARAIDAIDAAVAEAPRVSADLIFGLPEQSPDEAASHAAELVDRGLSHLSAYALTIEPGTRFGELARRGRLPTATDDATADAFLAIEAALAARGLDHYEVSNYARPGQEARHNLGYWRGASYLGLGVAAYGYGPVDGGAIRYRNATDPERYVAGARVLRPGAPSLDDRVTVSVGALDAETLLRERIMLGLRLAEGLDLAAVARELGLDPSEVFRGRTAAIERLTRDGALAIEGTRLRIPPARRLGTDGVAARLF